MRLVWTMVGGMCGLTVGAGLGFAAALVAMSLEPPRSDGTYGMREMLIALPGGALLGLLVGLAWGLGLLSGHAKP